MQPFPWWKWGREWCFGPGQCFNSGRVLRLAGLGINFGHLYSADQVTVVLILDSALGDLVQDANFSIDRGKLSLIFSTGHRPFVPVKQWIRSLGRISDSNYGSSKQASIKIKIIRILKHICSEMSRQV